MAPMALPEPSTCTAGIRRWSSGGLRALVPLLLVAGCASWHPASSIPQEFIDSGVTWRVLIPPDLNVNPSETVVKPTTRDQGAVNPPPACLDAERTMFSLPDAIAFALRNNP